MPFGRLRRFLFLSALIAAAFILITARLARARAEVTTSLEVDRTNKEVRIRATVHPRAMARPVGVQGHHAVVWKRGRAAPWALFRSAASDRQVRAALESLGAVPGENLTAESWTERKNLESVEPDKRVEGAPIDVLVSWGNDGRNRTASHRHKLEELISERGRLHPRADFRFGGNQRFQPIFKSGCIVCLYSCPGGAIGNHVHPIRDYVRDGVVYESIPGRLPPAGSEVVITLKLKLKPKQEDS